MDSTMLVLMSMAAVLIFSTTIALPTYNPEQVSHKYMMETPKTIEQALKNYV